jgi:hypothetical protein
MYQNWKTIWMPSIAFPLLGPSSSNKVQAFLFVYILGRNPKSAVSEWELEKEAICPEKKRFCLACIP